MVTRVTVIDMFCCIIIVQIQGVGMGFVFGFQLHYFLYEIPGGGGGGRGAKGSLGTMKAPTAPSPTIITRNVQSAQGE